MSEIVYVGLDQISRLDRKVRFQIYTSEFDHNQYPDKVVHGQTYLAVISSVAKEYDLIGEVV